MVRFVLCLLVVSAFFFVSSTKAGSTDECIDVLISALVQVESGGDDHAIGDRNLANKAYGALQIRRPCMDDVNERNKTSHRAEDTLGNRKLSVWCFREYMKRYATKSRLGREPTFEDMARIWNGGPNGHRKKSTNKYWGKVQEEVERQKKAD